MRSAGDRAHQDTGSYAAQYGSKDWPVAQPDQEGRDDVPMKSAKLLADGRTVFLDLGDLAPVMQMEVKWNLDADDGTARRSQLWLTLNKLDGVLASGANELKPNPPMLR